MKTNYNITDTIENAVHKYKRGIFSRNDLMKAINDTLVSLELEEKYQNTINFICEQAERAYDIKCEGQFISIDIGSDTVEVDMFFTIDNLEITNTFWLPRVGFDYESPLNQLISPIYSFVDGMLKMYKNIK